MTTKDLAKEWLFLMGLLAVGACLYHLKPGQTTDVLRTLFWVFLAVYLSGMTWWSVRTLRREDEEPQEPPSRFWHWVVSAAVAVGLLWLLMTASQTITGLGTAVKPAPAAASKLVDPVTLPDEQPAPAQTKNP